MEGMIIFVLLVAVIALLASDGSAPAAAPPVVIVQSQIAPNSAGCLPAALVVLAGLIVWALLAGG